MIPTSSSVIVTNTEDLSAPTRTAIMEVGFAATGAQDYRKLFSHTPAGGLHFLAFRDEVLVSHAMVTTRWLQPAGQPLLKTAYVDAVATLPEYQGRGYGSAVMRRLAAAIDAEYQVACLETERATGFYVRLGWQLWRGPLAGRGDVGLVPTPDQTGIMILLLSKTPPLDFDSMLTIECQKDRIW